MPQTIKTPYYYILLDQARKSTRKKQNSAAGSGAASPEYQANARSFNTLEIRAVNPSGSSQKQDKNKEGSGRFTSFIQAFAPSPGANNNNFPLVKIKFNNGDMAGKEFLIRNINSPENPGGLVKIGRGISPGEQYPFIVLNSRTISRLHAIIAYRNHKMIIFNVSAINPAQVNGKEIPEKKSEYLPEGATVAIGDISFTVEKVNSTNPG